MHMSQVHKEQLSAVDNALPNRSSLDVEIFGMEGVPDDIIQTHNQRMMTQFQQAEAERQAVTGNPPPGTGAGGQPAKRPKLENVSDLKKRLAEHKAKKAETRAGGSSGEATPVGAGQSQNIGGFVSLRIWGMRSGRKLRSWLTQMLPIGPTSCKRGSCPNPAVLISPAIRKCWLSLPTNGKSSLPNILTRRAAAGSP